MIHVIFGLHILKQHLNVSSQIWHTCLPFLTCQSNIYIYILDLLYLLTYLFTYYSFTHPPIYENTYDQKWRCLLRDCCIFCCFPLVFQLGTDTWFYAKRCFCLSPWKHGKMYDKLIIEVLEITRKCRQETHQMGLRKNSASLFLCYSKKDWICVLN